MESHPSFAGPVYDYSPQPRFIVTTPKCKVKPPDYREVRVMKIDPSRGKSQFY